MSGNLQADKAALDEILAGSPITAAQYSRMGDISQAGLQTVNSLCESLQITVNREGRQFRQDYVRGIAQHDLYVSGSENHSGTEVILKPDAEIFGYTAFSEEIFSDWITANTAEINNLKINIC